MPNSNFSEAQFYSPYEAVRINWDQTLPKFTLQTPWISIEVEVDSQQATDFREASKLPDSKFMASFKDFPVVRVLPRAYASNCPDPEINEVAAFPINITPRELTALVSSDNLATFPALEIEWGWDPYDILEKCLIPETSLYDPLAAFTVLREYLLREQYEGSPESRLIDRLSSLKFRDEAAFFAAMKTILAQNYYVTHQCEGALLPAKCVHSRLAEPVRKFIEEERGHHFLVLDSLRAMGGGVPSETEIFDETRLSMDILKYAAANHPLAFCCVVAAFEGDDHADMDPLAALLLESSLPKAAQGIQNHFLINKNGNHAAIGEAFVRELGALSSEHIQSAARLLELLCKAQKSVAMQMIEIAAGGV